MRAYSAPRLGVSRSFASGHGPSSGPEHALAADPDDVAGDPGRGRARRARRSSRQRRSAGRPAAASSSGGPASRIASGTFAVISVSMNPGATALIRTPLSASVRRQRLDQSDHSRLRGRVVGLAVVARDPADRGDPDDARAGRSASATRARCAVIRSGARRFTSRTRVPHLGAHVRQPLVPGDPGVVHDDVETAVARPSAYAASRCGASTAVMSSSSSLAADPGHHLAAARSPAAVRRRRSRWRRRGPRSARSRRRCRGRHR